MVYSVDCRILSTIFVNFIGHVRNYCSFKLKIRLSSSLISATLWTAQLISDIRWPDVYLVLNPLIHVYSNWTGNLPNKRIDWIEPGFLFLAPDYMDGGVTIYRMKVHIKYYTWTEEKCYTWTDPSIIIFIIIRRCCNFDCCFDFVFARQNWKVIQPIRPIVHISGK